MVASSARFVPVEKFFEGYQSWESLGAVSAAAYDSSTLTLSLTLRRANGVSCVLQVSTLLQNIVRIRFNPNNSRASDYPRANTRTIVQNTQEELRETLETDSPFEVQFTEDASKGFCQLTTKPAAPAPGQSVAQRPALRITVDYQPFQIRVERLDEAQVSLIWQTTTPGTYFAQNGEGDFQIIQVFVKAPTARYIGFGEHGGRSLVKQSSRLVYFNYDNMRYRQVYNQGPTDEREPLYHSDPFFMEFNRIPELDSVLGVFMDNAAQTCINIGKDRSDACMLGTRFGDLDFYLIAGSEAADVTTDYTSLVGRSRLKPRYILGYHQGCYGYEDEGALRWAVERYRANQIPLDGLHVDVDLQQEYRTFTVDTRACAFPDPAKMFADLRSQGIKCSTNITPIISNRPGYSSYDQALERGYFVTDERDRPNAADAREYQVYLGGQEKSFPAAADSLRYFDTQQPYLGRVWYGGNRGTTGHYPELGRKEVRDWWGTQYQQLFDLGLEMVWQDMTTPAIAVVNDDTPYGDMKSFPFRLKVVDSSLSGASKTELSKAPAFRLWNLYSYNLHKATYHGLNNLSGRENRRNFIIGRGCYSGMHRFAGLWTGDNASDWDFLRINIAQVLSLGMCGVAIAGQDIGGFESCNGERWPDPTLLMRWTMAGAFLPWFRNHYIRKTSKEFQEPFQYLEWFNQYRGGKLPEPADLYRKVIPVCRHYIGLRYRLLQLFYDAMFENMINGLPICRPLFINDPTDKSLFGGKMDRLNDEFFVRRDLLVAPIIDPESECGGSRPVYLPLGSDWYPFADDQPLDSVVTGGTEVVYRASLGFDLDNNPAQVRYLLPLYVRAGAIIPMLRLEQYVGQLNRQREPNPITFHIYPGQRGDYVLYLDDGETRAAAHPDLPQFRFNEEERRVASAEYRETRVSHERVASTRRRISVERLLDGYTPKYETYFYVALLHEAGDRSGSEGPVIDVTVNGRALRRVLAEPSDSNAWWYDTSGRRTMLKLEDDQASLTIEVQYRESIQ
jgi:alpha-glucosidase